jgi:hypothetical protein
MGTFMVEGFRDVIEAEWCTWTVEAHDAEEALDTVRYDKPEPDDVLDSSFIGFSDEGSVYNMSVTEAN